MSLYIYKLSEKSREVLESSKIPRKQPGCGTSWLPFEQRPLEEDAQPCDLLPLGRFLNSWCLLPRLWERVHGDTPATELSAELRTAPGKGGTHGKHKLLLSLSLVKVTLFLGSGNSALQCHLVSAAQSGSAVAGAREILRSKGVCCCLTWVLLWCVTQAGTQQLLVHSESIFYAAKCLVPLAGSDLDTMRKKQQEANAVSH